MKEMGVSGMRSFAGVLVTALVSGTALCAQAGVSLGPDVRNSGPDLFPESRTVDTPQRPRQRASSGQGKISADLLRHPLTEKSRQALHAALVTMDNGNHEDAVRQLRQAIEKYPDTVPYAVSLLGIEYIRLQQFGEAADSLQQAVALLPHDALNHYHLGLSLACAGDYERGEQEVRRAIQLDPRNTTMHALLETLESTRKVH
jgi:tetratricopeptide (TPR) repeat protein